MTIASITIRLFGRRAPVYRVMRGGEVVQVCCTKEEAEAWIAGAAA